MGIEIERRFLFDPRTTPRSLHVMHLKQAYLSIDPEIRVRSTSKDCTITIKSGKGIARGEWEYYIPPEDAAELMALTPWSVVEKLRSVVEFAGSKWTLDKYLGENVGLYVAEIELMDLRQRFPMPPWIGTEITNDSMYNASSLAQVPYSRRQCPRY